MVGCDCWLVARLVSAYDFLAAGPAGLLPGLSTGYLSGFVPAGLSVCVPAGLPAGADSDVSLPGECSEAGLVSTDNPSLGD